MNILKRLKLVFAYGPEIDELLESQRKKAEELLIKQNAHQLDLCPRHQQRHPGTHYAEHNCDYCKVLKGKVRVIDCKKAVDVYRL